MNTQARQKAAELIKQEFSARRSALCNEPTAETISNQLHEIKKQQGIDKMIARIEKLESEAANIRIQVSERVGSLLSSLEGTKKRSKKACECSTAYEYALERCALLIAKERLDYDKQVQSLHRTERELLASVLTCDSDEKLLAILKKAGLQ